jgi:hypothetical protein
MAAARASDSEQDSEESRARFISKFDAKSRAQGGLAGRNVSEGFWGCWRLQARRRYLQEEKMFHAPLSTANRRQPGEEMATVLATTIRAPRGSQLRCKGWQQEAALRCLMNNLDPEVAERPADLVVYGGIGRAARNWECFHAIVRELENLGNEDTLLVQSGKPVAVFPTHEMAPRVIIAGLVHCAESWWSRAAWAAWVGRSRFP